MKLRVHAVSLVLALITGLGVVTAGSASAGSTARAVPTAGMTASAYWRLDDLCRGSSDPAVYEPACRKRDRWLKAQGKRTALAMVRAWRTGSRKALRPFFVPPHTLTGRGSKRKPDCAYWADSQRWSCVVWRTDGSSAIVHREVTRHQRPKLPRWQVVQVAPGDI